jgi:hypothetical protein
LDHEINLADKFKRFLGVVVIVWFGYYAAFIGAQVHKHPAFIEMRLVVGEWADMTKRMAVRMLDHYHCGSQVRE